MSSISAHCILHLKEYSMVRLPSESLSLEAVGEPGRGVRALSSLW